MNAAIDLHDSEVLAVIDRDGTVVVRLLAYVHRSAGRPGIDPGSGWIQTVELSFTNALVEYLSASIPFTISDGQVSGGAQFLGTIPLPVLLTCPVRLEVQGLVGEGLAVNGERLDVIAIGEAKYTEQYHGMEPNG